MRRRTFCGSAVVGLPLSGQSRDRSIRESVVYESPDPSAVFAGSAGLARTSSGRLIATMNLRGPGLERNREIRRDRYLWSSRIYTSDDHGKSWQFRASFPMNHARPFEAGDAIYVLGHGGRIERGHYEFNGDLTILRSIDNGTTWSAPAELTQGDIWHQAPSNVHYAQGRVYLVMEQVMDHDYPGWNVSVLAPVLLAARITDDLSKPSSWVFSDRLSFQKAIQAAQPHLLGSPFFPVGGKMAAPGWLETNVVQLVDPDHLWHDPGLRTFHLWMRAHTGTTNVACIAKAVQSEDARSIHIELEQAPSGEPMLYVPCPGGQMKFHILYDAQARLFWLLSSESTDSMSDPERLGPDRHGLPNNERHRLVLHFSRNCVDWCFAATVANTRQPRQARHYASMVIDGDDLHVLSRSGDARARSAHDGNLITFHSISRFRELAY